ncbi:MAG: hypothetical protein NTW95_00930 [Candidatus Aminicenantes bacterium]|nr:hypothetical protein [Candidatus Aminicenantes bacterium]
MIEKNFPLNALDTPIHLPGNRNPLMTDALMSIFAAVVFVVAGAVPVAGQEIKGQRPVMMIGDVFQFNEGSWATYTMHDKKDDTYFSMTMSILESVRRGRKDYAWMEVEIETEKELVVTRFLTEKTKAGPGDLLEAIVYVYGLEPFSIPKRMLKDANKQTPPLQVSQVTKRIEQKQLLFDGESLDVWAVEGTDAQNGPMSALVSLGVAPIGVLLAETNEVSMYLEAWGGGATTRIKGEPVGFTMWVLSMVADGMSGEDIAMKERPQRTWDVAGAWREFEGPCTKSTWMMTALDGKLSAVTAPRCDVSQPAPVSESSALRWRSDRIVVMTLPGRAAAETPTATLIFVAPTKAVIWYTAPDGRPAFTTLRK